jgi:hypothetical protein
MAAAEIIDVRIRVSDELSKERFVTRANLGRVKQFILENGLRETYCNMYNNNPAYRTESFAFYLDPDTGQANINCKPEKSDFHTMTIRASDFRENQYRSVEFRDPGSIYIVADWPTEDLTVAQIRGFVTDALMELFAAMETA